MEKIQEMMESVRSHPPTELLGQKVVVFEDYKTSMRKTQDKEEPLALPKSNVLLFRLKDGSKVVLRPSGTEPKLKIYAGASGNNLEDCEKKVEKLLNAIL